MSEMPSSLPRGTSFAPAPASRDPWTRKIDRYALCILLVVAKIVHIDYPNEWPEAISTIIEATRSTKNGNQMHLGGALPMLLRVVKGARHGQVAEIPGSTTEGHP